MRHLNDALATFMESWNEQLTRAIASGHSKHELGTQMVRLRRLLGPRVTLADLPTWPPQIRDALRESLRSDLESIQQQLEEAVCTSIEGGRFDRAAQDGLVGVLRENSLTTLLRNESRVADGVQGQHVSAPTSTRSTRVRRLIL
ncbi:hypothetical protein [Brevibacterium sp.]|uniref:hypothetical protein n=1 Tax=Brevibacterium sp. TaxID=1701 RepID=UPI0028121318|nr:hypothetical protein [Brevibacterium sp.]